MTKAMIGYAITIFLGVGFAALVGYTTISLLVYPFLPAHAVMDSQ